MAKMMQINLEKRKLTDALEASTKQPYKWALTNSR